jgi:hypothetical protein
MADYRVGVSCLCCGATGQAIFAGPDDDPSRTTPPAVLEAPVGFYIRVEDHRTGETAVACCNCDAVALT